MSTKQIWLVVLIVTLLAFIIYAFYFRPLPEGQEEQASETGEGLGAEIYSETGAGAASDFPTANPTANPIEGTYKNPFE